MKSNLKIMAITIVIPIILSSCSLFGSPDTTKSDMKATEVSDFGLKTGSGEPSSSQTGSFNSGSLSETSSGSIVKQLEDTTLSGSMANTGATLSNGSGTLIPFVEQNANIEAKSAEIIQVQIIDKRLETLDRLIISGIKSKMAENMSEAKLSFEGAISQIATLSSIIDIKNTSMSELKAGIMEIDEGLKIVIVGLMSNDMTKYDTGIEKIRNGVSVKNATINKLKSNPAQN